MDIQFKFTLPLLFITIPILMTWIVYFITNKIVKHQWKAIHFSVQSTAIFYIIAVAILLQNIFHYQFVGIILICLIVFLAVILIIQWKKDTEVVLRKGLKVLLRISFLLFGAVYIILIGYEIVQLIISNGSK